MKKFIIVTMLVLTACVAENPNEYSLVGLWDMESMHNNVKMYIRGPNDGDMVASGTAEIDEGLFFMRVILQNTSNPNDEYHFVYFFEVKGDYRTEDGKIIVVNEHDYQTYEIPYTQSTHNEFEILLDGWSMLFEKYELGDQLGKTVLGLK